MIGALLSLAREWAALTIRREIVGRAVRRASEAALVYGIIAILGLASLAFFYVFAFHRLATALGDDSAAAILCGANLLLIALILIGRAVKRSLGRPQPRRAAAEGREPSGSDLESLLTIGVGVGKRLRENAPAAALVAAVIGLAIGARPELLDLLKPSRKTENPDRPDPPRRR
jgi:hypothetical protein